MKRSLLIIFLTVGVSFSAISQLVQTKRYELEKDNTDNYFNVTSVGEKGLVIFRDTDEYRRNEGDVWQVIALDTALVEKWNNELLIDSKHVFKGFEQNNEMLYLLFSEDEAAKSNYQLVTIKVDDGETKRYDIKNEISIELSHLIVVNDFLILGGYVRYSPTLISYSLGDDKLEVIPGFFKDRSEIIDLRENDNGTFNILTKEKAYQGYDLKLRTYAPEGDILFDKTIETDRDLDVMDGKCTGFVDGNIAISGTYGKTVSTYSQGIYFVIVKPEGQKDVVRYFNYSALEHFFDYMGPKRSERIKRKIDSKISKGKEFRYSSRLNMHQVQQDSDGYLLVAEIYNPQYEKLGSRSIYSPYAYGFGVDNDFYSSAARQDYVKRPGGSSQVQDANHFEYLESVILKLNGAGELQWDNSFKIEDVETFSLEPVVDLSKSKGKFNLVYKSEENINYKVINQSETITKAQERIMLDDEADVIKSTYDGVGNARHWYGDYFYVWGYHKIQNKLNPEGDNRRNVLFVNKITIEE
ncbi:hypothetical protein JMN32_20495 [Fulvivirga sp. 29W222]|uniref:Uncharacterized protein n=1 Tax=Fulvivirga marina TaxID=2494733 RepID=A0A937FYX1_9BACT|nr:hypothetical protein [Fulvivirga marina]MBL6448704.1 hypothetical protein [Fulvivirga marina]